MPASLMTSFATASMRALTKSSSAFKPTSGTITSGTTGSPVFLPASTAASKIARALHFGYFRIGNSQTATAMAKHRIELMQRIGAVAQLRSIDAHGPGDFVHFLIRMRQEFMQRRIEQADRDGQAPS